MPAEVFNAVAEPLDRRRVGAEEILKQRRRVRVIKNGKTIEETTTTE